jgi:ubiquinone/menaquinone biosynthesis C-methylase UbiE
LTNASPDDGFIPALRFHRLTPLFDAVVAVTVRDRTVKRRVIERAAIADGERVLDVGCGTGTLAIAAARAAPGVHVTGLDADPAILARARKKAAAASSCASCAPAAAWSSATWAARTTR